MSMWDAIDVVLNLASLDCWTDELSSCDLDALSMLNTKTHLVRKTPVQQVLPPYILTLNLHQKS